MAIINQSLYLSFEFNLKKTLLEQLVHVDNHHQIYFDKDFYLLLFPETKINKSKYFLT